MLKGRISRCERTVHLSTWQTRPMSRVATLAKVRHPGSGARTVSDLFGQAVSLFAAHPGCLGASTWQSQANDGEFMLLAEFAEESSANSGIAAYLESELAVAVAVAFEDPMDLLVCKASALDGIGSFEAPMGSYFSISERSADPGQGTLLVEELKRIFEELALIDGYLGSAVCQSRTLDEEVVGIVYWSKVEAYMDSLPLKVLYEVNLYHRIG